MLPRVQLNHHPAKCSGWELGKVMYRVAPTPCAVVHKKPGLVWIWYFKEGGAQKTNDESDVHLPQPQKKVVTYFILFFHRFFMAFLGVS
jgi:hypothetical protein